MIRIPDHVRATLASLPPIVSCDVCEDEFRQMLAGPQICPACMDTDEYRMTFGSEERATSNFDHDLYLKRVPANAPLRYTVRSFCEVCEQPILPPAANHGLTFCLDCRRTPEYRELVGR